MLAPFAGEWNSWPLAEKRIWLSLADQSPRMHEDQRERARHRVEEWARLSPAERRQARENYRLARQRPATERAQAWKDYESLSGEQKSVLREAAKANETPPPRSPNASSGLAPHGSQPFPRLWTGPSESRPPGASRSGDGARPADPDRSTR